jgi:alkylation response protein AidB-like acyl-CoA dehydrogenase
MTDFDYLELDTHIAPEQRALKTQVRAFARDVLRPAAIVLDRLADPGAVLAADSPLWPAQRAAYGAGFHTALIPPELGGLGLSGLSLHIALEELGWGSADFAINLAVAGIPFAWAAKSGDVALIEEFVKPFVADRTANWIGCWAITEPDHGSDHFLAQGPQFRDASIHGEVTATRDGDGWIIHGEKSRWISNGTLATHALVYLSLNAGMGMAGGGVALVPLDLPGVSKGEPLDKMGQRGLNQGAIRFERVRIPARNMLMSDAARYVEELDLTLSFTAAAMGAIFTGVARAAFEEALAYTRDRIQGGKPICEHQLVQKHLYDMFVKVETARALSRAAMIYNQSGAPVASEYSTAAKTYCTETACEVTDAAMGVMGGHGLTKAAFIEKLYRDARASIVEDGVNDVLALSAAQLILARAGGGRQCASLGFVAPAE